MIVNLCMFLYLLHVSTSDWVADWMTPVQEQLDISSPRQNSPALRQFEDQYEKLATFEDETVPRWRHEESTADLKRKVENTLELAKALAETLEAQILELSSKEMQLKEAIANGRSGISTVTVSTLGQRERTYIIREGIWTLCTGIIQPPSALLSSGMYNGLFSSPRCIGQEVTTRADPCVFNSIIKYETIPSHRRMLYTEDDYLCLKSSFNKTLEQYLSVPRRIINETCVDGQVRSLQDNQLLCGIRVLSEYLFYPHRSQSNTLPLEYCKEVDGACRLLVGWHVSNATIEDFEFLKQEDDFKKFFMSTGFNSMIL